MRLIVKSLIRQVLRFQIRSRMSRKGRQYNGQKKKDKRTNNVLQNITQQTKERSPRTPQKNRRLTQVLRRDKQLPLHTWHPSCYFCYKPDDKLYMRIEPIVMTTNGTCTSSFVTQIIRNSYTSHGGDLKLSKWWLQFSYLLSET